MKPVRRRNAKMARILAWAIASLILPESLVFAGHGGGGGHGHSGRN